MIDFAGQVAVVTGAGRGLGRLYALDLARRGAAVVVNDVGGTMGGVGSDTSIAEKVAEEIRRNGGSATASCASVDSAEGGQAIVDQAVADFGRLDVVVSNAGIFNSIPFEHLAAQDWRRMLQVHLDGGFYLSQPAYRVMMKQRYGRFVFISSSAGNFGQPLEAHYAAAKTGLVGLSNVLAIEGAAHGIVSNTVLPTGLSRMVTETVGDERFLAESGFLQAIRPELVVPLVTYLASSKCTVTHRNYSACAGRYARVFTGLGHGWLADPDHCPVAEDIEQQFELVSSTDGFIVPDSIVDEVLQVCERRGISAMPDDAAVAFPEPRG
ncbi:SDR family NAD(P)-dependent oxidoreductase [Mycobacterium sp. SMC-4]|uniref:SDR family NAD(P)-dependent oxidoreductase n=1 Tax=Mycobacterium sp. SMC-4 TaxID=2857059 RepID=UPI003D0352D6